MTLSEALDKVYGHNQWHNPIRPYFASHIPSDSPLDAYRKLKPELRDVVVNLVGCDPEEENTNEVN